MKKVSLVIVFLITVLSFTSCSKDDVVTDVQKSKNEFNARPSDIDEPYVPIDPGDGGAGGTNCQSVYNFGPNSNCQSGMFTANMKGNNICENFNINGGYETVNGNTVTTYFSITSQTEGISIGSINKIFVPSLNEFHITISYSWTRLVYPVNYPSSPAYSFTTNHIKFVRVNVCNLTIN
ncbi:exported hypothetical protein [Flavobacterium sp. 9AF]|uniref:hypothetical protein n=1 Tax=Flavobacterium sp. 9AF TaxID=2653142 RepID=UPI0012F1EDEE|nr:hypothetical protein [Flavobacterium sp. 9AF]VXC02102.1 exported hypothetical protein [Flavobacterium sp. 9AF]